MKIFNQFKEGLARSRGGFAGRLGEILGRGELDETFYEELEEVLVAGDVGVETSLKLVETLRSSAKTKKIGTRAEARKLLEEQIVDLLSAIPMPDNAEKGNSEGPRVILLVGVNGSGKTTTAAKLAYAYKQEGKKVLMVAGDTFRAAAVDQLAFWSDQAGVDLIRQNPGSDPSALYFDALNAARARSLEVVIGDTAGRLHSKYNLMEELNKIFRVVGRSQPGAPHEVLLVLDANIGQNALAQAENFNRAVPLTGLVLAKLDGTARGGIVIGIQDSLQIPVRYVGIGEKIDDLARFDPAVFTRALLES